MPSQEEIFSQQKLLAAHRQTISILLEQVARVGVEYAQPGVINGINEARENIRRTKEILRGFGVQVDDEANDKGLVGGRVLSILSSFTSEQRALIGSWRFVKFNKKLIISGGFAILNNLIFFEDGTLSTNMDVKGKGIFSFIRARVEGTGKYTFPATDTVRMEIKGRTEHIETVVAKFNISGNTLQLSTSDGVIMLFERFL